MSQQETLTKLSQAVIDGEPEEAAEIAQQAWLTDKSQGSEPSKKRTMRYTFLDSTHRRVNDGKLASALSYNGSSIVQTSELIGYSTSENTGLDDDRFDAVWNDKPAGVGALRA